MLKQATYLLFFGLILSVGFLTSCKGGKDIQEKPIKHEVEDEFKKNFHRGIREKMKGNFDIAETYFQKCLSIDQNNDAVHFALSDIHESLGNPEKSLSFAKSAFELDKTNKWYTLRLANMYYKSGNYHKSAALFELIIEDEKNLDIKFKYAEALIHSKDYKRAIEMLDEIEVELGKSPHLSLTKHDLYLELKNPESAQKELDDLINDVPSNVENRLVVADYFLQTNQVPAAQKVLNEAMAYQPENGEIQVMLADISLRKNDLSQAFVHLKKGFEQDDVSLNRKMQLIQGLEPYAFGPGEDQAEVKSGLSDLYQIIYNESLKNDTLHYRYGVFLRESKEYSKAAEQFQKVTDLNPGNYNGWRQLLHIQDDLEQYESMLKNGEAALEVYPSQPEIYLLTGIAARKTQAYDEAEEWLFLGKDLVLNEAGLSSEFLHQIGRLYSDRKEFESAINEFDKAAKLDPFNGNIYGAKAEALLALGKKDGAVAEIQKGLDQAPTSPFLLDAMGQLYFKMENFDRAIGYFNDAIVFDKQAIFLEHLGDAFFKKGNKEKASEYWLDAKELGRDTNLLNKKIADQTYYEN